MQSIDTEFVQGNYRYTQITRRGMLALYAQQHREAPVTRYEVIRIQVHPAHTWPNGTTSPEREAYPASSSWGTHGWTCHKLDEAQRLLTALEQAHGLAGGT